MFSFIWNEKFWLPHNVTWDLMKEINSAGVSPTLTKSMDCFYAVAVLTAIRLLFEKELSKTLNLSDRSIEAWFRKKRNCEKFPTIVKLVESEWKLCYYTTMFFVRIICVARFLLLDVRDTMMNYPYHVLTPEIHWYYMVQLGYYTASLLWIFYEVKRSDFKVLLGHHISTVLLLTFSYITNYHRVGAVVLILHDIADCWMEAAKICKYVNKQLATEVLFYIFVPVWIVTRLTYFPLWVIWATFKFSIFVNGPYPAVLIMVGFLLVLQILHIYWFCLIVKIAIQVKSNGRLVKDCRSESELSDESNQITKLNPIHETKCYNNYHHTNQPSLKSNDVSINNNSNITTTNNNNSDNNVSDIISDDNKLNQRSNHCMQ
ncbi:unnamed protein product [Schistosoma mattheei]|uniref:TLC domain-containing protein n=1 Tax=Schistosoma mattheei TaxID=31246 RepID=A0AA85BYK9_9TREM|nr:unnamed protein product [Schistosoma mattheei]